MSLIVLIIILLLVFGGGGGYYGYRTWGPGSRHWYSRRSCRTPLLFCLRKRQPNLIAVVLGRLHYHFQAIQRGELLALVVRRDMKHKDDTSVFSQYEFGVQFMCHVV